MGYSIHWRINDVTVDPSNTLDRVEAIARERNLAMKETLDLFPDAQNIFMLDSYYADQYESCLRLIDDYNRCKVDCILSGAIWGEMRTHASHLLSSKKWWLDTWGFPECRFMPYGWMPKKEDVVWGRVAKVPLPGFYRVESVGSAYIFPTDAFWKTSFKPCEDLSRTEHYFLCRNSGLPCYVDFNAPLWRRGSWYSPSKCLRVSIGELRRKLIEF